MSYLQKIGNRQRMPRRRTGNKMVVHLHVNRSGAEGEIFTCWGEYLRKDDRGSKSMVAMYSDPVVKRIDDDYRKKETLEAEMEHQGKNPTEIRNAWDKESSFPGFYIPLRDTMRRVSHSEDAEKGQGYKTKKAGKTDIEYRWRNHTAVWCYGFEKKTPAEVAEHFVKCLVTVLKKADDDNPAMNWEKEYRFVVTDKNYFNPNPLPLDYLLTDDDVAQFLDVVFRDDASPPQPRDVYSKLKVELKYGHKGAAMYFSEHKTTKGDFKMGKFSPVAVKEFNYPTLLAAGATGDKRKRADEKLANFDTESYVSIKDGLKRDGVDKVILQAIKNKWHPPPNRREKKENKEEREKKLEDHLKSNNLSMNTFLDYYAQFETANGMLEGTGIQDDKNALLPEIPNEILTDIASKKKKRGDQATAITEGTSPGQEGDYDSNAFLSQLTEE